MLSLFSDERITAIPFSSFFSKRISKPDEIVYQEPVLASCQFIPQMIVEQQQATVFTNALAGAVIYDGILHKEEGWCSIS